jgi:hypothetical protein
MTSLDLFTNMFRRVVRVPVVCGVVFVLTLLSSLSGQVAIPTGHSDDQRTAQNTNEIYLMPSNVNSNTFGALFNYSISYQALAQPLYVPGVVIPGQGTHNVVYVATMDDSVYAFDADSNLGSPLWYVNFTNPALGITTASVATKTLPCASTEASGEGFTQEGIIGTPAVDTVGGTIYLVAKTVQNGTVYHHLHALDITTGAEKFGGPIQITATSVSNQGKVTVFNSLHQKNRPGLLLFNGTLYMAFGSNGCNDHNSGWVLSYNPTTLQQEGVFNTSPDLGLTSIWQTGNGIAGDDEGYIFAETAESSSFNVPSGGQSYSNSVIKLSSGLALTDYFTPANVAYLNDNDLDMSSCGVLVLPDQSDSPYVHEAIASGKQGTVYVLNRDNMGMFTPSDTGVVQELDFAVGAMFSSPAYWNNTVYFAGDAYPVTAYPLSGGLLGTPVTSAASYAGSHSPSISANGNTNGVLWMLTGGGLTGAQLFAFNASNLSMLYNSKQNKDRDTLPNISHFITQTVANGKVYIATRTTLSVYGLLSALSSTGGGEQSGAVLTQLPTPLTFQALTAYSGDPIVGATVTFSDGGKGGVFNPASAVTNSSGNVSTSYTLPKKVGTYTITATSSGLSTATVTETATAAAATRIILHSGNKQTGSVGEPLAKPLIAEVVDANGNGVSGVTVTFNDQGGGGLFSPVSVVSNSQGWAQTSYQLPTKPGTFKPLATAPGLKPIGFAEYAVAGPAFSITLVGGNNQTGPAGTQLPQALVVLVSDQYNNPVSGVSVTFSDGGAGGSFSNSNPVTTATNGTASQFYTLPTTPGPVTVSATVSGLSPAVFTETGH